MDQLHPVTLKWSPSRCLEPLTGWRIGIKKKVSFNPKQLRTISFRSLSLVWSLVPTNKQHMLHGKTYSMVLFSQAAGGSLPEKLCDGKTKICLKKVVMIRVNGTIQKVLTRNKQ